MRPIVAGGVKGNGRRVDRDLSVGDGHQSPPEAGDDPPEVAKFKRTTPGALLGLSDLGRRRGLLLATFDYEVEAFDLFLFQTPAHRVDQRAAFLAGLLFGVDAPNGDVEVPVLANVGHYESLMPSATATALGSSKKTG